MSGFDLSELITLREAVELIPNRPHISTIWRWTQGVKGRRLKCWLIGNTRFTTRKAIEEFIVPNQCATKELTSVGS